MSVMYAWNMPSRSARACSTDASSFNRPTTLNHQDCFADSRLSDTAIGTVRSTGEPACNPRNTRGVTPTIVTHVRPTWIILPRIDGLRPNRRSQSVSLITATGVSGPPAANDRSSAGVNTRPYTAGTPRTSKYDAEAYCP